MRVWIIKTAEPVPGDAGDVRLERAGLLAQVLSQRGHDVTWWASTFDHVHRRQRFDKDTTIAVCPNYTIRLLYSAGYRKNVSLARAYAEWAIARRFAVRARAEPFPDVILCCMPSLDLAAAATSYGKRYRRPVVLDIRDLWPDVFAERLPHALRHMSGCVFAAHRYILRQACRRAVAISGITSEFVDWGVRHAGRPKTGLDLDFPLGYPDTEPGAAEAAKAASFWRELGITDGECVVCFLGSLGQRNCEEFEALIQAARLLSHHPRIRFVLCGEGVNLHRYKALAADLPTVLFPGWIGFSQARVLMELSAVGIIPYQSTPDFMMSIPNKAVEYMSAGLPVVSSVKGKLQHILSTHECGATYANRSPQELAGILLGLEQDRGRLHQMGDNARQLYRARFVASAVYSRMAEHLEGIAGLARCGSVVAK